MSSYDIVGPQVKLPLGATLADVVNVCTEAHAGFVRSPQDLPSSPGIHAFQIPDLPFGKHVASKSGPVGECKAGDPIRAMVQILTDRAPYMGDIAWNDRTAPIYEIHLTLLAGADSDNLRRTLVGLRVTCARKVV